MGGWGREERESKREREEKESQLVSGEGERCGGTVWKSKQGCFWTVQSCAFYLVSFKWQLSVVDGA